MTLIVGFHYENGVVIGSESEESAGYTSKRQVTKLVRLVWGDSVIVIGAAGDSFVAENGIRRLTKKLESCRTITEDKLTKAIDDVLATLHDKYIDKEKSPEGVAFIVAAALQGHTYLISTHKRTWKFEDSYCYAGYGGDLAIYFLERIHTGDLNWEDASKMALAILAEVKQSTQGCSGESQLYTVQASCPRWRLMEGQLLEMTEFNDLPRFTSAIVEHVKKIKKMRFDPKAWADCDFGGYGYSEEEQD
ncbi:MAG TPA: hypothetical protein VK722_04195 [Candidatus Aquilonibacter sp.]|nr:hypothetical protein [Candidatus Aquilonibacter sp.]